MVDIQTFLRIGGFFIILDDVSASPVTSSLPFFFWRIEYHIGKHGQNQIRDDHSPRFTILRPAHQIPEQNHR